jgi:hypothetical protein
MEKSGQTKHDHYSHVFTAGTAVAQTSKEFLVNRHTKPKGESLKARASEAKRSVQAQTVGINAPGVDRVLADKAQTHCPRLERLAPEFLKNRSCPDTHEFLNN